MAKNNLGQWAGARSSEITASTWLRYRKIELFLALW